MPCPSEPVRAYPRGVVAGGAVLLLLLLVTGLGRHDWWYPDEPDVALPAIEMQARGDWVVPTHNGEPWLDYPPLAYWGARVVGWLTGGIDPFATRLPMLVMAGAMVAATVGLGRRWRGAPGGALAGAILAGTPLLWYQATHVQVDLGYATAMTLGLLAYLAGDAREGHWAGWAWRVAGFAGFGVAVLGKGPLGLLLPGLILTLWHGGNREWRKLLQLAPLTLVAVAVALPWYVWLVQRLGGERVGEEFYLQNFDRFQATTRGHGGKGWAYYGKALLVDALPWSLLIGPAIWRVWRDRRPDRLGRLLAIWVVAPFLFFTFASTKRNVYLLPIYPAVAVLVAGWLRAEVGRRAAWWRSTVGRGWSLVWVVLGAVLLGAALAWPWVSPRLVSSRMSAELLAALRPGLAGLGAVMALVGWYAARELRVGRVRGWSGLGWGGLLIAATALHTVVPTLDRQRSYQPAAQWLAERVPEGGAVGYYWPGREAAKRPAWLCHLGGRRLVFLSTPAQASTWLEVEAGRLLLTTPVLAESLPGAVEVRRWTLSSTTWVVVRTRS